MSKLLVGAVCLSHTLAMNPYLQNGKELLEGITISMHPLVRTLVFKKDGVTRELDVVYLTSKENLKEWYTELLKDEMYEDMLPGHNSVCYIATRIFDIGSMGRNKLVKLLREYGLGKIHILSWSDGDELKVVR